MGFILPLPKMVPLGPPAANRQPAAGSYRVIMVKSKKSKKIYKYLLENFQFFRVYSMFLILTIFFDFFSKLYILRFFIFSGFYLFRILAL